MSILMINLSIHLSTKQAPVFHHNPFTMSLSSTAIFASLLNSSLVAASTKIDVNWCTENDESGQCQKQENVPVDKSKCQLIPDADSRGHYGSSFQLLRWKEANIKLCFRIFLDEQRKIGFGYRKSVQEIAQIFSP